MIYIIVELYYFSIVVLNIYNIFIVSGMRLDFWFVFNVS